MSVSKSAFYAWLKRSNEPSITEETLRLHRKMKQLFEKSRNSLGSREMMKNLREEGFTIGRYRVRKLMDQGHRLLGHQKVTNCFSIEATNNSVY